MCAKIDEILGAKFIVTTQICCLRSGVHARYQEELETDCCRGKHIINCLNRMYGLYLVSQDQMWFENEKRNNIVTSINCRVFFFNLCMRKKIESESISYFAFHTASVFWIGVNNEIIKNVRLNRFNCYCLIVLCVMNLLIVDFRR